MAYLPENHYCYVCGEYLGPDDGDADCGNHDICDGCGYPIEGCECVEAAQPASDGQDLDGWKFRAGFQSLWNQINGKRAPWDSNPWVWVIEFKRVEAIGR